METKTVIDAIEIEIGKIDFVVHLHSFSFGSHSEHHADPGSGPEMEYDLHYSSNKKDVVTKMPEGFVDAYREEIDEQIIAYKKDNY